MVSGTLSEFNIACIVPNTVDYPYLVAINIDHTFNMSDEAVPTCMLAEGQEVSRDICLSLG